LRREDRFLSRVLGKVRKHAKANDKHHCIITHVRDQKIEKTDGGVYYYPMPTARDLAGGQVWFRKGMSMLMFWRPPVGIPTFDDALAEDNELHVRIAKTKPKGTSKNGVYKFFLNTNSFRYYHKNFVGKEIYSNRGEFNIEQKPREIKQLEVNQNFDFEKTEKDDLPF